MRRADGGAAALEAIFATVLLLLLALGVVEVAFALYGRNVVYASAHEGARAAVEFGRDPADAVRVATDTVRASSGDLVEDLHVTVSMSEMAGRSVARVRVEGVLRSFGPIPLPIPVGASATSSRPALEI